MDGYTVCPGSSYFNLLYNLGNYFLDIGYKFTGYPVGRWEKNEKVERKTDGKYIKNGVKGIKNAPFWVKTSRKLVRRRKKLISYVLF